MKKPLVDPSARRQLLKSAFLGGAAAVSVGSAGNVAIAATASSGSAGGPAGGYVYFTPAEATLVEAAVDHMVPADALSPKGTDLGIAVYIDRALEGAWGKGDRLYMQGPWAVGVPSQGYQCPLSPAQLCREGFAATLTHCKKTYGKGFEQLNAVQKDEVLNALANNKVVFAGDLSSKTFFDMFYQTVVEGMFADPIYGGNVDKAGWKMIGFPGVIATHSRNIVTYKNKTYSAKPMGLADVS